MTASTGGSRSPAQATNRSTLEWLDALKGVAIAAVVFDHAFIVDDYLVWKHAYFAVSWFIFLAGVSNTLSARRRGFTGAADLHAFWQRRLRSLLGPYLWITLIAVLLLNPHALTPATFGRRLLLANAQPQLYFVPLLLQLLLVFPLLDVALYRCGWWGRGAVLAGVLLVGPLLSSRITLPWTLGAHYLLGASFLYLFVLGMLAAPLLQRASARHSPLAAVCLLVAVLGERALLRSGGFMMTHPPSNAMLPYTVALLGLTYAGCRLFSGSAPVRLLAALGGRSLDIFLYHYLFLLPFLQYRDPARARALGVPHAQAVLVAVAIPTAIAGALLLAWLSRITWRLLHEYAGDLARHTRNAPPPATPHTPRHRPGEAAVAPVAAVGSPPARRATAGR
ncbi:MAG TPA: acyltransferase family protein [Dehalococcoidia bacterium]|nr:acyltransferase family protein [Dehalococcoidia bacterium]